MRFLISCASEKNAEEVLKEHSLGNVIVKRFYNYNDGSRKLRSEKTTRFIELDLPEDILKIIRAVDFGDFITPAVVVQLVNDRKRVKPEYEFSVPIDAHIIIYDNYLE